MCRPRVARQFLGEARWYFGFVHQGDG